MRYACMYFFASLISDVVKKAISAKAKAMHIKAMARDLQGQGHEYQGQGHEYQGQDQDHRPSRPLTSREDHDHIIP